MSASLMVRFSEVNLPLEIWKSKFSTCIIWYVLGHMLARFEPNRMIRNVQNFEHDKNPLFLIPLLTKRWRHFARRLCSWNNCLMVLELRIFQTIFFLYSKKESNTFNQSNRLHQTWQTRQVRNAQSVALR